MRTRMAIVFALALVLSACRSDGADRAAQEPRTGYGNMGLSTSSVGRSSLARSRVLPLSLRAQRRGLHEVRSGSDAARRPRT